MLIMSVSCNKSFEASGECQFVVEASGFIASKIRDESPRLGCGDFIVCFYSGLQ